MSKSNSEHTNDPGKKAAAATPKPKRATVAKAGTVNRPAKKKASGTIVAESPSIT